MKESEIFETHYQDYCKQLSQCDLPALSPILGIEVEGDETIIPFMNRVYRVSGKGIRDKAGHRPAYGLCVILAKYLLLCPGRTCYDPGWAAFRDFKKDSAIINVNFFTSDVEQALTRRFQGRVGILEKACIRLGGKPHDTGAGYDLSMTFDMLPRIRTLLLFNDREENYPARCQVLFQKHAEFYLDPESLAMVGAGLAKQLVAAGKED